MMRRLDGRSEKGFTILELLIAVFLGMLVLGAGYTVFQGGNRASIQQNLDNRMQDNARIAMDVLARDFRRAGLLVKFTNYPPGFKIENRGEFKLVPVNSSTGPDSVEIAGATLTTLGLLQADAPPGSATIVVEKTSDVNAGTRPPPRDYRDVIAVGLHYTGVVTALTPSTISLSPQLDMMYYGTDANERADVRLVTLTTYSINRVEPRAPRLMQTTRGVTEPVAEHIEDLQLRYGVDSNGDMMIQPGEWTHNPAVNTETIEKIRLVRITIVARSDRPDPALVGRPQTIPAIEDRAEQADILDGYRRYILTRIVKLRNISNL